MKQGQSSALGLQPVASRSQGGFASRHYPFAYTPLDTTIQRQSFVSWVVWFVNGTLGILWALVSLPVRLAIGIIGLFGRLVGICLGFVLMVVGVALWAGPLFILGIPLFFVGLLLTLRCLS